MTPSTRPPKTLRSTDIQAGAQAPERPTVPKGFADCPESRRIMEEMIFHDRFSEEFEGRTHMVGVNEVTAIKSTNPKPCVGTSSLTSCVGIAAYDDESRVGAVAHVKLSAGAADLEHVRTMIGRVMETASMIGGRRFILYSFNGKNGNREWNAQLSDFVEKEAGALISAGTVTRFESRDEHNFVLDTRDGSIFTAKVD